MTDKKEQSHTGKEPPLDANTLIRLNPQELMMLTELAKKHNMTPEEYAAACIKKALEQHQE